MARLPGTALLSFLHSAGLINGRPGLGLSAQFAAAWILGFGLPPVLGWRPGWRGFRRRVLPIVLVLAAFSGLQHGLCASL